MLSASPKRLPTTFEMAHMTLRVLTALLCAICVLSPTVATAQERAETINVDTKADGKPFPHFWEEMFGSGRAILSLRESYRRDCGTLSRLRI